MLEDFDPPSAPTVKEYAVTVNDGNGLQIQCSGGGGDVFLAGVEVIGLSSTGAGETRRPAGTRSSLGLLRAQKGYLLTVGSVGAYRLEIVNPRGAIVRSFSGTGPAHHTFSAARGVYIVRHAHAPGMQQKVLTVH
jgi:hypothetical protein